MVGFIGMNDTGRAARADWDARVVRPGDGTDLAALDAEFWARIPLDERAEVAWQLSLELWRIAEPDVDHEHRLSGAPARVVRG
jgi:hypothetical protein